MVHAEVLSSVTFSGSSWADITYYRSPEKKWSSILRELLYPISLGPIICISQLHLKSTISLSTSYTVFPSYRKPLKLVRLRETGIRLPSKLHCWAGIWTWASILIVQHTNNSLTEYLVTMNKSAVQQRPSVTNRKAIFIYLDSTFLRRVF